MEIFLLHHDFTHRSVLHADDVQSLLQVVYALTINSEYHGLVILAALYLIRGLFRNLINSSSIKL